MRSEEKLLKKTIHHLKKKIKKNELKTRLSIFFCYDRFLPQIFFSRNFDYMYFCVKFYRIVAFYFNNFFSLFCLLVLCSLCEKEMYFFLLFHRKKKKKNFHNTRVCMDMHKSKEDQKVLASKYLFINGINEWITHIYQASSKRTSKLVCMRACSRVRK